MTVSTVPSYVCGPSDTPLVYQTVDAVLRQAARQAPGALACVFVQQSIRETFASLDAKVECFARALRGAGLRPGDRIGIWAPNCFEWLLTMFAAARAGLILVNINPAYRKGELEHAVRLTGLSALVFAAEFKGSDYAAMLGELIPTLSTATPGGLADAKFPHLRILATTTRHAPGGCFTVDELNAAGDPSSDAAFEDCNTSRDPDDPYNIQFTSGTTGLPKGATLSHFNIVNNGYFVGRAMRLTEHDRLCVPVPLYHCFGMVLGVLAAMTHRAACVFPSPGFDAEAVLRAVQEEQCTVLHGVPTMFIAELEHPHFGKYDLSSLRTGIMAGSPCPISVMNRVVSDMHMPEVTICYGMTETSPVSFQSRYDDALERRVTTVGTVHPHVQVKIVDAQGRTVPRGVPGELLTRGYSVMRGYWADPERTRDVIDEAGWMHTGDIATIDDDGFCNITGRVKDLIIRGGENISPREVEEFLYRHPAVADVVVLGVPDENYGEAVCACVRLRDGTRVSAEELRAFCKGQIAHFKVPRYIQFVSDFPMTVTGKVQKYVLRHRMCELLDLKEEATA
jgi:fatty-acyl-CoA synthase